MHVAAACDTVTICAPIAIVPLRPKPSGFAATTKSTVPLPVPVPVPLIVIHGALVVAVQLQPACVVNVIVAGPPDAGIECVAGVAA